MKVTVLIENDNTDNPDLEAQNGLSLFIETHGKKILMDFGADGAFVRNAEALDIDLSEVDFAVLTNSHQDHGGGLEAYLEDSHDTPIYVPAAVGSQYAIKLFGPLKKPVGLEFDLHQPEMMLTVDGEQRIFFVEEDMRLDPHTWLLKNRFHEGFIPKGSSHLYEWVADSWQNDRFLHERALVFEETDGLVVVTGCAYSGIGNLVRTAQAVTGNPTVKAVVGGFQLLHPVTRPLSGALGESDSDLEALAEELSALGVRHIVTGHCSGEEGFAWLSRHWTGGEVQRLASGAVIYL